MKQKINSLIKINLKLRGRESIGNLIFKWITHTGRIIIIVTEIIALVSLGYRFVIDRQIIDLHDKTKQEMIIIKSQEEKEEKYRSIQKRLGYIATITNQTDEKIRITNEILSEITDRGLLINKFAFTSSNLSLSGKSSSLPNIVEFIDILKKKDYIVSINLDQFSNEKQSVSFSIAIALKEGI